MHRLVERTVRRLPSLAALLLLVSGGNVLAQPLTERWYVDLFGGASLPGSVSATLERPGLPAVSGDLDTKAGAIAGGALGYRLARDWRIEAEVAYRSNTVRSTSLPGLDRGPADADLASLVFMVNGYYDFAPIMASFATFRPYVGLGVGLAQEVDADLRVGGAPIEFSGSRVAYQLAAGVRWHYASRWSASLGVRYLNAGTVEMTADRAGTGPMRIRYDGFAVTAGIGYRF
jgi:opacity protein-like surface antigen